MYANKSFKNYFSYIKGKYSFLAVAVVIVIWMFAINYERKSSSDSVYWYPR